MKIELTRITCSVANDRMLIAACAFGQLYIISQACASAGRSELNRIRRDALNEIRKRARADYEATRTKA